jgi:hypothetical protein
MEVFDRIKLLINYDSRKTLTENVELLNEDAFTKLAREGGLVAKELEGTLKAMNADAKVANELKNSKVKPGGIQTADDLLLAITTNKLSGEAKGLMNSSILKSGSKNQKLISAAAEDLVKSPAFAQKYFPSWKSGGRPNLESALKNSGKYSEDAITQIVAQTEKNLANVEKLAGKELKPKAQPKPKQTTGGGTKDLTPTKPKPRFNINLKEKLKEYLKKFPKANWKQIVKWGAGIGITAAVLWYLFHDNDDIPVPTDIPPTDENLGGGGGGTNDGGTSGGGAGWTDAPSCEDVQNGGATMSKGMMGDCVGTVQTKLNEVDTAGLKVDNKFGKRTKKAVENFQTKNGLTATGEVDKETYDKLFGGATTGSDYEESPDTTAGADEDF